MAAYFKTIAAFANNSGGYLVFGIGDSPRSLLGLNEKSLKQFEDLRVEDFSKHLLEHFSSEIRWEHTTFESNTSNTELSMYSRQAENLAFAKKITMKKTQDTA